MPARYGPRTDIVISEQSANMLQFLTMIERTRTNDQQIAENDIVESLISARYDKVQTAFNKAMETLKEASHAAVD
jgi:hypothetical protein